MSFKSTKEIYKAFFSKETSFVSFFGDCISDGINMPDPIVKDSRLLDIYIWGVDHELLQLHRFSTVEEIISEFCTNKKGKLKVIENLTNIQKKTVAYLLFQRCYVEHRDDYGASEWFEKFSASL